MTFPMDHWRRACLLPFRMFDLGRSIASASLRFTFHAGRTGHL